MTSACPLNSLMQQWIWIHRHSGVLRLVPTCLFAGGKSLLIADFKRDGSELDGAHCGGEIQIRKQISQ